MHMYRVTLSIGCREKQGMRLTAVKRMPKSKKKKKKDSMEQKKKHKVLVGSGREKQYCLWGRLPTSGSCIPTEMNLDTSIPSLSHS